MRSCWKRILWKSLYQNQPCLDTVPLLKDPQHQSVPAAIYTHTLLSTQWMQEAHKSHVSTNHSTFHSQPDGSPYLYSATLLCCTIKCYSIWRERERVLEFNFLHCNIWTNFLRIHQGPWVSDASLKDILGEQLSTLTDSSGPLSEELVLLPLALLS